MRLRWGVPPLAATLLLMGGAAYADAKTDALISKAIAASKAAKSLTATIESNSVVGAQKVTNSAAVQLMKPNFARVSITSGPPEERVEITMTGKDTFLSVPAEKKYQRIEGISNPTGGPLSRIGGPILNAFFDDELLKRIFSGESTVKYGGKQVINKIAYETVVASRTVPTPTSLTAYFGPSGLCEGAMVTITPTAESAEPGAAKPAAPPAQKISWWLRGMKVNPPTTEAQFAYKVPAGFEEVKQPERPDPEKSLLAVGKPAPEFKLPQPGGGELSLTELVKEKKAVLVNFWFRDCPACNAEFPLLQKLYEEKKDQGFELVAVNSSDPEDVIQKYVQENKFTFKVVMGAQGETFPLGDAYGVMVFPTNYLIGPDGNILWRGAGFNEAALRAALEKAGVK